MSKVSKVKESRNSFNLEDAFKCVFFLLIAVSIATVVYTVVLMAIAEG